MEVLRHTAPPPAGLAPPGARGYDEDRDFFEERNSTHDLVLQPVAPPNGGDLLQVAPRGPSVATAMPGRSRTPGPTPMPRAYDDLAAFMRGPLSRHDNTSLNVRIAALLEAFFENLPNQPGPRAHGLSQQDIELYCGLFELGTGDAAIGELCCVCMEPMRESQEVRAMKCRHMLHRECCEAWLSRATTCPTCRSSVIDERTI